MKLSALHMHACRLGALVLSTTLAAGACAIIDTDPSVPASMEAPPQVFPSIAIGDSLRDTLGVAHPLRVILRNIDGDVIENPPVSFLYVQSDRDSAIVVDAETGFIRASGRPGGATTQIAARFEEAIQVLIPVVVTNQPDTVFRTGTPSIKGYVPDIGPEGNAENSTPVTVQVQYRDSLQRFQNVGDWLVRFAVVRPDNRRNDSSQPVFFVTDNFRTSQLDTTDGSGTASRRLRIRPSSFPAGGAAIDTVEVEAMVFVRGDTVRGAPVRILIPVCSAAARLSELPCGSTQPPVPNP